MSETLPPGPYRSIDVDGIPAPWYIIPFDKDGDCSGPLTREALVRDVANGQFTDLFMFSHGWNNDWTAASSRYDEFIRSYMELRKKNTLTYAQPHRPILVGIFWPSTALVAPWEEAPKFAGDEEGPDLERGASQREVQEVAELLEPKDRAEFYLLAQRDEGLSEEELHRLAELVGPAWNRLQPGSAEEPSSAAGRSLPSLGTEELIELWKGLDDVGAAQRLNGDDWGYAGKAPPAPQSAGLIDVLLKPRDIIRALTVRQMKDRAAVVGERGVGMLLRELLRPPLTGAPPPRVHLIGHSYGCMVALSAICRPAEGSLIRKVDSVLLLQPAVSRWCFAEHVADKRYPGGFRETLKRVKQPILTTFSKHDVPLTKLFHLALRRDRDLGEPKLAGVPDAPSRFAALGGFGPSGCAAGECDYPDIHEVKMGYDLAPGNPRILALRSDAAIKSHGAVSVPATWWALFSQVNTVLED